MEMQFDKISVPYLEKIAGGAKTQEQTLELRISDGMPDIGRVLGAWGQVIVRGKEWHNDQMTVSCGVMAQVLYVPEDADGVRSVDGWLPFTMKWELPDSPHDGKIVLSCLLKGIDVRSTSARKLMVRATLSASAEAWLQGNTEIETPMELPDDVEILTESYPLQLPKEAGEKAFLLEEQLTPPTKIEKMLYYHLQPEILEKKVMAGKVVFRGVCALHTVYLAEDDGVRVWDTDVPFSQYADLDDSYDQNPAVAVIPCVTGLDLEPDENGDWLLKAGILGQYLLSEQTVVTLASDAYSPARSVDFAQQELAFPAILEQDQQTVHAEQPVLLDVREVVDVTFLPAFCETEHTEDGMQIAMTGQFQTLYYDAEGELGSVVTPWKGEKQINAGENVAMDVRVFPAGKPQAAPGADGMLLRADMLADTVSSAREGLSAIGGMQVGESEKPDPGRPSLVICRKGNRRLWDVAKQTGSTVEKIMAANRLEGEPDEGQVLLIPVS